MCACRLQLPSADPSVSVSVRPVCVCLSPAYEWHSKYQNCKEYPNPEFPIHSQNWKATPQTARLDSNQKLRLSQSLIDGVLKRSTPIPTTESNRLLIRSKNQPTSTAYRLMSRAVVGSDGWYYVSADTEQPSVGDIRFRWSYAHAYPLPAHPMQLPLQTLIGTGTGSDELNELTVTIVAGLYPSTIGSATHELRGFQTRAGDSIEFIQHKRLTLEQSFAERTTENRDSARIIRAVLCLSLCFGLMISHPETVWVAELFSRVDFVWFRVPLARFVIVTILNRSIFVVTPLLTAVGVAVCCVPPYWSVHRSTSLWFVCFALAPWCWVHYRYRSPAAGEARPVPGRAHAAAVADQSPDYTGSNTWRWFGFGATRPVAVAKRYWIVGAPNSQRTNLMRSLVRSLSSSVVCFSPGSDAVRV